jgi:hypothetical protein
MIALSQTSSIGHKALLYATCLATVCRLPEQTIHARILDALTKLLAIRQPKADGPGLDL